MPVYRYEFETPRHEVVLPEYHISQYPVAKAQFRAFVEDSGHETDSEWRKHGRDNHPVVMVSWYDAMAYCDWLNEKIKERGWRFSLPTEAEWEKSVGCLDCAFPWGNDPDTNRANFYDTGIKETSPIGCFPGGETSDRISDMIGNATEWTTSLWGEHFFILKYNYPYQSDDGRENSATGESTIRVLRGGSWCLDDRYCRSTYRFRERPDNRNHYIGFRLVRLPARLE